ncbi:Capsular polysaccharide biosynthesis protein [Paenibacillus sp. UNCCL117]|uniref:YveK family protein n=1 Tax=unclassified Paenibacillus TaxID=185978 RepID=UPI000887AEF3|nr:MULTISPECIES: Wzz/FepE/Etk N-terminal domain-containing protein [unclassified Paenibacillus]SDC02513.1 Capsular polysaccharide biosynthesis protein [Paenibacillus sp. cl123]SFW36866.1 Capsular polysaccharide biosynthesis protein [Paenibacillus sp. UNCCL117]
MEPKELMRVLKKRLWIVLLVVAIATITTAMYNKSNYQPIYQASTKVIVNKTVELEQLGNEQMDLGSMAYSIRLIDTYKEIIRTPAIMEKVVQRYPDLKLTAGELSQIINVQSINNTQVMTIMVRDFSYERAMQIVNAVTAVFQSEIPKIMKVNNIEILHNAEMKERPVPVNQQSNMYVFISAFVALVFALGAVLLLEFLDDTLKSEQDVERVMGLELLAAVPVMKKNRAKFVKQARPRNQGGEISYATVEN